MSASGARSVRYVATIGHPAERAADPAAALVVTEAGGLSAEALAFVAASRAPRTLRAYRSDLADFCSWCRERGRCPLPASPETLANYLASLASSGRTWATVSRRLSAVSQAHRMAGLDSPAGSQLVRLAAAGIRRTLGAAPRRARPVLAWEVAAMADAEPPGLRGLRDGALLVVGFGGGFRRSELAGLDADDVAVEPEGLRVLLRRSKTDQAGEGRLVGVSRGAVPGHDAVDALLAWKDAAGVAEGPLFREVDASGRATSRRMSDRAVARAVKRAAARVGIDPALVSGHSLRAGLATSAAAAGAPERAIMATTGHRSDAMARRYVREAGLFTSGAGAWIERAAG